MLLQDGGILQEWSVSGDQLAQSLLQVVLRVWQTGAEDVHRDQEADGGPRVNLQILSSCHKALIFPSKRSLVCVLIDEVESLTAARKASGSEPSDAIRFVISAHS